MKSKGDETTITTPWWREPHTGKIVDVFCTPYENYYIVEFDDGTKCTAKEQDLKEVK